MQWGKEKSNRWLTNALVTFVFDIIFLQPIKVMMLSFIVAALFRRASSAKTLLDSASKYEIEKAATIDTTPKPVLDENQKPILKDLDDFIAAPKPPGKREIEIAQWNAKNSRKMQEVVWEIIFYVFYLLVLTLMTSLFRNTTQYNWNTFLLDRIDNTEDVLTVVDFWDWVDNTVLPEVYDEHDYLGERKNWKDRKFMGHF